MTATSVVDVSIRPFRFSVPEEDLVELRRSIDATRWPDNETVPDRYQDVPLAKLRPLVEYWGALYDGRKIEAKLNSLPVAEFLHEYRAEFV